MHDRAPFQWDCYRQWHDLRNVAGLVGFVYFGDVFVIGDFPMRLTPFCIALFLTAGSAAAQNLDVPFEFTEDAENAGCPGATVMGLDPSGDGFLSVWTGPGS